MTRARWQLLIGIAVLVCGSWSVYSLRRPATPVPTSARVQHRESSTLPVSTGSQLESEISSSAPEHPTCKSHSTPLRMIGERWLEAALDRPSAVDPPSLGKFPLAEETWTWFKPGQFDENADMFKRRQSLLYELTALFRRHEVSYWLNSGTLLGAYRHGAQLPWDDDMDVTIPHEHRERLQTRIFRQEAKAAQLYIQNGFFCNAHQYVPIIAYLKRHVHGNKSRFDPDELFEDCAASVGFFGRVTKWDENPDLRVYIDLWNAFPVTIRNRTLFSYGGGEWLFSREDIYPLQRCWLDGQEYSCPARSRLWLVRDYKDLSLPWVFDDKTCSLAERRSDSAWESKWTETSIARFPQTPQLYIDSEADSVEMYVPEAYREEAARVGSWRGISFDPSFAS